MYPVAAAPRDLANREVSLFLTQIIDTDRGLARENKPVVFVQDTRKCWLFRFRMPVFRA